MKQLRALKGVSAQGAVLKTAVFEGAEHIVVPVVALVEGVLHASNSPAPELVLAEEFSKAPQGWNGRPAVGNHPVVNGQQVSANSPGVLEDKSIGRIFEAHVSDKKLLVEAWLDPKRANEAGTEEADVITRLRAGEAIEVSVGVFVISEDKPGTWKDGSKYASVWREIVPDHIAMLPDGTLGACSNDMGCGAPRAAAEGGEVESPKKSLKERFLELMAKFKPAEEGTSDSDLRGALDQALFATEPGYLGIMDVFQDAGKVVYAVAPDGQEQFFRRSFTAADDGAITLGDDPEEVRLVMQYEPITAAAGAGTSGTTANAVPVQPREATLEKKERVAAIIASDKTCFAEADAPVLEQFSDERLASLYASTQETAPAAPAAPAPAPTPELEPAAAATAPTTEEAEAAYLESAPESIKNLVAAHKAAEIAKVELLVGQLKTQDVYKEEELRAMSSDQLEKLVALAVPKANFAGAGSPRVEEDSEAIPAPPSLKDKITAARSN